MASTPDYVQFVCEQLDDTWQISYKKMFGEYMVYANNKPVLLICDNTVFVKIAEELGALMQDCDKGFPYDGAREHYILDAENRELVNAAVTILERITPVPVKKKPKIKKG